MSRSERWTWIALVALALILRLAALNVTPLAPDEALAALPALAASRGEGWPLSAESPLLLVGNALLFTLFGGGTGAARLLPALVGSALVALPLLWRKQLGATGALAGGALLALSPTPLFASRRLDPAVVGAAGAALILTALFTGEEREHPLLFTFVAGAGTLLGLLGGPNFYDLLLPGLAAWFAYRWMSEKAPRAPSSLLRGLSGGAVAALLVSVGFGLRWNGWSGPADGFAAWLGSWSAGGAVEIAQLLLYEPLSLLLALVGLILAVKRSSSLALSLALWGLLGSLLLMLRSGASPPALIAPVLPLILLAGWSAQHLLAGSAEWQWLGIKLHVPLSLVFWLFAGLALTRQTTHHRTGMEAVLLVLVLAIQGLITAAFATLADLPTARRGLLLGLAAALLLVQLAFGVSLAYVRSTEPTEPLVETAASHDLYNLRRLLKDLRRVENLSPERMEVWLVAGTPEVTAVTAWALHDLPGLRIVETWPEEAADLVITPADYAPSGIDDAFVGLPVVALVRSGGPVPGCKTHIPLDCHYPLAWYLYRTSPVPYVQERVILWKNQTLQP
ncbi:MAG: hypothetical protein ACLFU8_04515 [Anaerolineales bacterium]